MTQQQYLYGAWFILTAITALLVLFLRYRRSQLWKLTLAEAFKIALDTLGLVSGGYLIAQTWIQYDALFSIVGNEGIVAMAMGGLASIWFCIGQVKELILTP